MEVVELRSGIMQLDSRALCQDLDTVIKVPSPKYMNKEILPVGQAGNILVFLDHSDY